MTLDETLEETLKEMKEEAEWTLKHASIHGEDGMVATTNWELHLIEALMKCKLQRDNSMGDFTLDCVRKIDAAREKYDAELLAILRGGG